MMKCRLRESRLIAINEGERSLTAADVSAVYQINGDETKHSARNRMLANLHAGRGTHLPSTWKLGRPLNTSAFVGTNPTGELITSGCPSPDRVRAVTLSSVCKPPP